MTRPCPKCGKPVSIARDVASDFARFRPFCSERCQLMDLGGWLSGQYAIPGEDVEDVTEDAIPGLDDA